MFLNYAEILSGLVNQGTALLKTWRMREQSENTWQM